MSDFVAVASLALLVTVNTNITAGCRLLCPATIPLNVRKSLQMLPFTMGHEYSGTGYSAVPSLQ